MTAALFLIVSTLLLIGSSPIKADEIPAFKPPPTRASVEANVVLESMDFLPDCEPETLCIEGILWNNGGKQAKKLFLRVEIGGNKHTKPRTTFTQKVEKTVMEPGERQEFYMQVARKITYIEREKQKMIEVGKYNLKVIPRWGDPVAPKPAKKPKKKASSK